MRERLKQALSEKDEYLAGWQRAKADLVNYKKEADREREMRAKFAAEDIIESLMPILDSFNLARANKETWERVDRNWRQGIEYIHAQLLRTLFERGFAEIDPPLGSIFDIGEHASVENVATDDTNKDGTIAEVVQKGYALSGKSASSRARENISPCHSTRQLENFINKITTYHHGKNFRH